MTTSQQAEKWELRLYIAGQTQKSLTALANLRRLCDEHLAGRYQIEVIDLLKNPRLAKDDKIVAIQTLVRKVPALLRKLVGDLSDSERVLVGLQLRRAHDASISLRKWSGTERARSVRARAQARATLNYVLLEHQQRERHRKNGQGT